MASCLAHLGNRHESNLPLSNWTTATRFRFGSGQSLNGAAVIASQMLRTLYCGFVRSAMSRMNVPLVARGNFLAISPQCCTKRSLNCSRGNAASTAFIIQFGFRLCADGKHVEPDPAEQAVLNEIRRMRQGGTTLRGIAAALNHRAFRTRRGSAWRLEHVARIVKQNGVRA